MLQATFKDRNQFDHTMICAIVGQALMEHGVCDWSYYYDAIDEFLDRESNGKYGGTSIQDIRNFVDEYEKQFKPKEID